MNHITAEIVFWVVVRDKQTKQIIQTQQFKTHDEAIHYDFAADGGAALPANAEVSIEILTTGKSPR